MAELTIEQRKAIALAKARQQAAQSGGQQASAAQTAAAPEAQYGSILPLRRDAEGLHFDSDAGILGPIKRTLSLGGDVMSGEVPIFDPSTGNVSDEVIQRSLEAAMVTSPVNPGVRSGDRAMPGVAKALTKTKPAVPLADDLLKAGGKSFDDMRATGAEYPSSAVKQAAQEMMARLNKDGFDDVTAPKTFRSLGKLANPPENSVATIGNLHSARKSFGKIPNSPDGGADYTAARTAISGLDDLIRGYGEKTALDHPLTGARKEAARLLAEGNGNYSAGKRSDLARGIERSADLRAAAANSGQNTGNSIRGRVATALLQPKKISGYNADEIAALEGVVNGSKAANATRHVGNLFGGGGGLGQMLTGGVAGAGGMAVTGSPAGMAAAIVPMAVGAASKSTSNFLTSSALRSADEMIRMRSPLYERMVNEAPNVAISPERRAALIRALMLSQQGERGGASN